MARMTSKTSTRMPDWMMALRNLSAGAAANNLTSRNQSVSGTQSGSTIRSDGADDLEGLDEDAGLDDGAAQFVCRSCGQQFDQPKPISKWDSIRLNNQRAFKKGELDILVTTKGF